MTLMMFDFLCPSCGHTFEDMIPSSEKTAPCPKCAVPACRQISPVRIDRTAIALTKGASPESIAHFDRIHRERLKIEEKSMREHGDYGTHAGSDGGSPVTREIASTL